MTGDKPVFVSAGTTSGPVTCLASIATAPWPTTLRRCRSIPQGLHVALWYIENTWVRQRVPCHDFGVYVHTIEQHGAFGLLAMGVVA